MEATNRMLARAVVLLAVVAVLARPALAAVCSDNNLVVPLKPTPSGIPDTIIAIDSTPLDATALGCGLPSTWCAQRLRFGVLNTTFLFWFRICVPDGPCGLVWLGCGPQLEA